MNYEHHTSIKCEISTRMRINTDKISNKAYLYGDISIRNGYVHSAVGNRGVGARVLLRLLW